jgi:hypothetical protein
MFWFAIVFHVIYSKIYIYNFSTFVTSNSGKIKKMFPQQNLRFHKKKYELYNSSYEWVLFKKNKIAICKNSNIGISV